MSSLKRGRDSKDDDNDNIEPPLKRHKSSHSNTNNNKNENKNILLPINECKDEILSIINDSDNDIIIITGDTGSGKSTQLSQILYSTNLYKSIIITQPRRIGAVSLSRRVAKEMNTNLGDIVGYQIRFNDYSSSNTKIKYVTDGILLRELLNNDHKIKYDVIILDEAHERSLQTDILFSILRDKIQRKENKFKLLITSATLNVDKFSSFFMNAPVYHINGRCFPVETFHIKQEQRDYINACIDTILQIHINQSLGHILCFLTGQEEIERACKLLGDKLDDIDEDELKYDCVILPAYGSLSYDKQQQIFAKVPDNCRKIIFATNIAETSLTVSDITYVIDPGLVKQKQFNFDTGIDELIINNISKISAIQRKGRAGRTKNGKCYRLYTKKELNEFDKETVPEILRANLCSTILTLKVMGIDNINNFEYLDKPNEFAFINALNKLYLLGAIDKNGKINKKIGYKMSKFPLDPIYSKILIESMEYESLDIALNLVSIISANNGNSSNIFIKNKNEQFESKYGDIISWLLVFNYFLKNDEQYEWCKDNFVNYKILKNALKIRDQLKQIVEREFDNNLLLKQSLKPIKSIRKVLAKSLFMQSAIKIDRKQNDNQNNRNLAFKSYGNSDYSDNVYIHPSSISTSMDELKWIIYLEITYTSKPYMKGICCIKYEWIKKLLPKCGHKIKWIESKENDVDDENKSKTNQNESSGNNKNDGNKNKKREKIDVNSVKERYLKRKMLKNKLKSL